MVTDTQHTMPLDVIEATWLVTYLSRILSQKELVDLRIYALAKYIGYIEEM